MFSAEGLKGWGKEGEEQPEEYLNKQDPNYSKRSDEQLSAADIEVRRRLEARSDPNDRGEAWRSLPSPDAEQYLHIKPVLHVT